MSRHLDFRKDPEARSVLLAWWQALDDNRGDRAALRRCHSPDSVVMVPAFHRLVTELRGLGVAVRTDALARVAGLAVHVKGHTESGRVARQMAERDNDRPRVSELRFRRLLAFTEADELYPAMRRTIRLLDGSLDLIDLAQSLYWWNDRTRKEWAYDYYGKTMA
jgi:CRISPR system Cascade subunit CasB